MEQSSSSVRVFCRFRPTRTQHASVENELKVNENTNSVILGQQAKFRANVVGGKFHFDRTFPSTATQQDVYGKVGHSLMEDTFKGYNTSIIAYGQTGSGKTHTMFGPGWDEEDTIENIVNNTDNNSNNIQSYVSNSKTEGLVPRIALNLFDEIEQKCKENNKLDISVYVTIIEIYNESIRDLLKSSINNITEDGDPKKNNRKNIKQQVNNNDNYNSTHNVNNGKLKIRESKNRGVYIDGIERRKIVSAKALLNAIREGGATRAVASTKMNDRSSRSHVIVGIHVLQRVEEEDGLCSTTRSKISLVDLAGSERVGKTLASGQTLKEAQSINQSLSALGNCMRALTQPLSKPKKKSQYNTLLSNNQSASKDKYNSNNGRHIPYRNSKLTHLLKSSLGGNAKTTLIVAAASDMENLEETISTLRFGIRAKRIKNNAIANKSMTLQELHLKIRGLTSQVNALSNENSSLKRELTARNDIENEGNNNLETVRYLKQTVREKDSLLAAEKLKTSSLEHSLAETKEKLKLTEESWKEMKNYGEELLVQLSQAEEQQLALQTSIVYDEKKVGGDENTSINMSNDGESSDNNSTKSETELQALRATISNEMELLDNWRSELYAWKTEIDDEQEKINETYLKQKYEFDMEKKRFEEQKEGLKRALQDEKIILEKEKNEYLIQSRKLTKDQKMFKIKEKQFKKDQMEAKILVETHEKQITAFEMEKKDYLIDNEQKQKYFNDLDVHFQKLRKELDDEWNVKAANEKWRNELLEWRDKITQEYDEKVEKSQKEKESIRAMKGELENQKLSFSSECKKKLLDIDTRREEYASKLNNIKKIESELLNKTKQCKMEKEELNARVKNLQLKEQEYEDTAKKKKRKFDDLKMEIETMKRENEENLREKMHLELVRKEAEIEKTIEDKYNAKYKLFREAEEKKKSAIHEKQQEKQSSIIHSSLRLKNNLIESISDREKQTNRIVTSNVMNKEVQKKDNVAGIGNITPPLTSNVDLKLEIAEETPLQTMEKPAKVSRIKRLSLLRKKKSNIEVTTKDSSIFINAKPLENKSDTSSQNQKEKKRRSSNYERIKRLRELRDKAKAKNDIKEEISVNLYQQLKEKQQECLKITQENLSNKHGLQHMELEFVEVKRALDHQIKQSTIDKERIYDLEQQLLSLYASIALHQEEERKYHESKMQAANVAKIKMEEADLEYARRLSQRLNTNGGIDATSSLMQNMKMPVLNESYFADERTSSSNPLPKTLQSENVSNIIVNNINNPIDNIIVDDENTTRKLSSQLHNGNNSNDELVIDDEKIARKLSQQLNKFHNSNDELVIDDEEVARKLSQRLNMSQMEFEPATQDNSQDSVQQRQQEKNNKRSSWSSWWNGSSDNNSRGHGKK